MGRLLERNQIAAEVRLERAEDGGAVVVNRVRQQKKATEGYNANTDKYEDLVAAGVIDPALVVRTALHNAASVACQTLKLVRCPGVALVSESGPKPVMPRATTTPATPRIHMAFWVRPSEFRDALLPSLCPLALSPLVTVITNLAHGAR